MPAALADYSTTAGVDGLITTALADYSTTAQVNGLVGGIDLSNYYEKTETYSQAEVNSVVSGAIDALNIAQYRTESQISASISDALVPYCTSAEVDSAIAGQSVDLSDYYTKTQSDSRYFVANATGASSETFTLIRDTAAVPRQLRGILPRSPLSFSLLFSGTITELRCDAYSKAEADGRYLSSTGYTSTLDGRYLVTNANPGGAEVFTLIRNASAVPRQLRGILPRAPLGFSNILSGTVTELTCDAWTKTEADGRYATAAAISAIDSRVSALKGSGGLFADIACASVTPSSAVNTLNFTAAGNTTGVDALFTQDVQMPLLRPISAVDDHLRIAAGLSTRMVDNDGTTVQRRGAHESAHQVRLPARHRRRLWARHGASDQRRLGLGRVTTLRVDNRGDLAAQVWRDAVQLILGVAVLHDFALAAEGAPLRNLTVATRAADAANLSPGHPVQVAPDPGELAVRVTVSAIADVLPGQPRHEGAEVEEPRGRILQSPEARLQFLDYLQSSQHQAVALLEAPGPASQDPAVIGANRRSPDHVKVAWGELGKRLPGADVGADGRVGFRVDIKRGDFPPQFREGSSQAGRGMPLAITRIVGLRRALLFCSSKSGYGDARGR